MKKSVFIIIRRRAVFVSILSIFALTLFSIYHCLYNTAESAFYDFLAPTFVINKNIFLDPGHGGEDPGCIDRRLEIFEKDINLKVAQLTKNSLRKSGANVAMSRESDIDHVLPKAKRGNLTRKRSDLLTRINMAVKSKSDIFVSIHVNATRNISYSGAETFYNPDNPNSVLLANCIQNQLRSIPGITKRSAKPGQYFILNNTPMPSVIVEMSCLTNPKEKALLVNKDYQKKLAEAITFGLIDYYKESTRLSISSINQSKPKVAIIIDDFGQPYNVGRKEIFALKGYPLTLAVMPNFEKTSEDALKAKECGFEVLIHMPMQSVKGNISWLGPGAITKDMTSEQITKNLENARKEIPMAVGINNHMGSLITQREDLMLPVMKFLKANEFFYIDSRTTESSVCDTVARRVGVPFEKRNAFLDNTNDYASIKKQILKLGDTAEKKGYAIGIGHVGTQGLNTARALKDTLPILKSEGIELVYVSDLIKREP